ncbi:BCD family MFS transporter [Pseudoponticoccus marisrubri]|uniref:Bacteriochlorophyll synthase n=1 Tax=Pseudoponticoccus marisrubri TaxID=1685382 RepID=A0A0W7WHI5_9RHOB|nr:BCD family MFS transporter [Pseudoponticoccus marisrubri]KUF10041.1 bacteriochlorophyll synthase [Pseudoponticoccus marisrubri]
MTLSWLGILRLGLVQMALGMIVVLTTATMNRVMVVELALPAILPGLLVSLYYGTQFLRPHFGHGADTGGKRTPWIIGGVAVLGLGAIGAALSVGLMARSVPLGIAAAVPSFLLIGLGIGAGGTNLLALLAARVGEGRQAAAGSAVWIMMIFGLAATGITAGQLLDPYSPARLVAVTAGVAALALSLTVLGVWGQERRTAPAASAETRPLAFRAAARELWADRRVRGFTIFVFASMLAYNLQDLILEPFAGHVFALSVGESTALGGMHHAGALIGMLAVLISGTALRRWVVVPIRVWIVGGCLLSGAALIALAYGGTRAPDWPLAANVFTLGLANGAFAVAAIGAMMGLAREGDEAREGIRMGLFGAAQAIAFGLGSFLGTAAADVMRGLVASDALAYGAVFAAEGGVFLIAALLALSLGRDEKPAGSATMVPGE